MTLTCNNYTEESGSLSTATNKPSSFICAMRSTYIESSGSWFGKNLSRCHWLLWLPSEAFHTILCLHLEMEHLEKPRRQNSEILVRYHMGELRQQCRGCKITECWNKRGTHRGEGQTSDPVIQTESQSLAEEVGSHRFSICTVVWYDILTQIQQVSKILQSPSMQLDVAVDLLKKTEASLVRYRDTGFASAQASVKDISKRLRKTKRQFSCLQTRK